MPPQNDVGRRFVILRSATRHGITPAQIRHALRNAISLSITEVGFIESTRRTTVIHAMPARHKHLR